jgi:hypothetical protein
MILDDWYLGLRSLFDAACDDLKSLAADADFAQDLPETIVDDMSNGTGGYSWICEAWKRDSFSLMNHLMSNFETSPCTQDAQQGLIWRKGLMTTWMAKAASFNEKVAMMHHTIPGQGTRIGELCDHRIRNGLRGRNA